MVSIIILSYNTKELLQECLKSLYKNIKGVDPEVIVVDNASTDGTSEAVSNFIRQLGGSNFKLIKNDKNCGFSKGNNIGARAARGEYLVFLNSDTEVRDNGLLGMLEFLETHPTVGILGGRLKNMNESLQKSAGVFYNLFNLFLMLFGGERIGILRKSPSRIMQVDWVSGAFVMIRQELFEKLKGFDENFFMYMEDMEICFRAKKFGFSTYFYPSVNVLHKELGSSNRAFAILHIYEGLLYFYKKHKSGFEYQFARGMLLIKALFMILLGSVLRNTYLTTTYQKAFKVSI